MHLLKVSKVGFDFFKFGNIKKSHGPNLENTVDGCRHRRREPPYTASKRLLISLHDFPYKKQESNNLLILLSFHISQKTRTDALATKTKLRVDSAEVLQQSATRMKYNFLG